MNRTATVLLAIGCCPFHEADERLVLGHRQRPRFRERHPVEGAERRQLAQPAAASVGEAPGDAAPEVVAGEAVPEAETPADAAGEAAARVSTIAASLRDRDLRDEATYRLAQAHFAVGDFVRSVELLRQTVDAFGGGQMLEDSRLPRYLAAWPRAWLALGLASIGQFAEATVHGEEAVGIAEAAEARARVDAGVEQRELLVGGDGGRERGVGDVVETKHSEPG